MTDSGATVALALEGPALVALADLLCRAGYEVCMPRGLEDVRLLLARERVDAWIIDARGEEVLPLLLGRARLVLPADNLPDPRDMPGFLIWADGLLRQLDGALFQAPVATPTLAAAQGWQRVRSVCLLAGSAGATSAVQQFLNVFDRPPPVAFIYAQHYAPDKQYQLEQYSLQNRAFSLCIAEGTHTMAPGQVLMIPPRCRIRFEGFGRVSSLRADWGGGHTPDISELLFLLTAARLPAPRVIFFSGMGDDGTAALQVFDAAGGQIWAQAPGSAVCPGMPQAAIDTGLVSRVGNARQLAQALLRQCQVDLHALPATQ